MISPSMLIEDGERLFSERSSLMSLWQEIGDHFYPERADFTTTRQLGAEFMVHLMSSYPVMVRRDLGDSFSSMLRPKDREWFKIKPVDGEREDNDAKRWLERSASIQRRAMYDRVSRFVRTTKAGDHDYATFGQTVISVELSRALNSLLYRNWHLRDCAWRENAEGEVDCMYRKWNPAAQMLKDLFGEDALSQKTRDCLRSGSKKRYDKVACYHIAMPVDDYAEGKHNTRFVSIYIEVEQKHIIEETGVPAFPYVVPRWVMPGESQYAFSPATIVGLADARLMQAMSRVLLEASEKATNPPMVATQDVVREDLSLYAGGITWVDAEYDERLGDALRPLTINSNGIPIGLEFINDIRDQLASAWYLNKLVLPAAGHEMTAFEVSKRTQEWVRQVMPLFEPMETEYNGILCDATFNLMLANGGFGSVEDIPRSLRGTNVEFRFESPWHDALDEAKSQDFVAGLQLLQGGMGVDPTVSAHIDIHKAFRDSLNGIVPAEWMRREQDAASIVQQSTQQQEAQQMVEMAAQVAGGQAGAA